MNIQRDRAIMALVYVAAFVAGALVLMDLSDEVHPLLAMFGADLIATLVIFVTSLVLNNSSMYDPYWSAAPIAMAVFWAVTGGLSLTSGLLLFCILAWGIRLTWNFLRGWPGLHHEDWRYVSYREDTGLLYWGVSLGGFHLFPTTVVFLAMIPTWYAFSADVPLNAGMVIGALISLGGTVLEGVADNQLRDFRAARTDPEQVLAEGVWAWCRHPNYLGEILFWWGLWVFGLSASLTAGWSVIGALGITVMFKTVSLSLIDNRMLEKRPHYQEHIDKRSALLPFWRPR
jgi:steroid 5-alpha reductase family enzyme